MKKNNCIGNGAHDDNSGSGGLFFFLFHTGDNGGSKGRGRHRGSWRYKDGRAGSKKRRRQAGGLLSQLRRTHERDNPAV